MLFFDVFWPLLAFLGTAWLFWGEWLLILGFAVVFVIGAVYRYGPHRERAQTRWVTLGAIVATVAWVLASFLLSFYIANFANFNKTYGSLGAAIGFMTWLWVTNIVILLGAEINAELEHQTAEDTTEGPAEPLGTRGATMADTIGKAQR